MSSSARTVRLARLCLPILFMAGLASAIPALAASPKLELAAGSFDPAVPGAADRLTLPLGLSAQDLTPTDDLSGAQPFVVQWDRPVGAKEREDLEAVGCEIVGYLPEQAYLVRGSESSRDRAAEISGVRWAGLLPPAWRLSPAIGATVFVDPSRSAAAPLRLRVRTFETPAVAAARFAAWGLEVVESLDDGMLCIVRLTLPRERVLELLPRIAADPLTWWIEEEPEFRALNNATKWVVQSNVADQTPLWDRGLHGEGELVVLMDSGLDYNSCFFRDTGNAPPSPTHRKVTAYGDYGGNTSDGCDTGHGTHVAGTIAGDQSFINPGNTNHAGMAYGAKLGVQDVGNDGFIDCLLGLISIPGSLTTAFNDAYGWGARLHTNSWGSSSNAYDTYCVNVDQFMWSHPEFLIFFANGNSGPGAGTVSSPATSKNCVSVGATKQAPSQETIASYSSRGPASDQRLKPTLTAPGGDNPIYISSANNNSGSPPSPTCNVQGSPFAGTSMATPAAAGLGALVRQYFRTGFYPTGVAAESDPLLPTGALIKAVLVNGSTDMGASDLPNQTEGWGRLRLDDALYFDGETRELRAEQDAGVATAETRTFVYEVDSSAEPLEVVLVWTDYPATSGAGVALVNDLDLTVTAPGGAIYLGNVFTGGVSTTGGAADRRNVEEVVRLASPAVGSYTIEVRGHTVPQGALQPFALASTAAFAGWPESPTAVSEEAAEAGWTLSPAEPNPTSGATTFRFLAPSAGPAALSVHDLTGRRVRMLSAEELPAGIHLREWDGRDDHGREVAAGVYYVRLRAPRVERMEKVTLLR